MTNPFALSVKKTRFHAANGWLCRYCGEDLKDKPHLAQIEHIHPKAQGGHNGKSNLGTACRTCNASKGPRTVEQYRHMLMLNHSDKDVAYNYDRATRLLELCARFIDNPSLKCQMEQTAADLLSAVPMHIFYFERVHRA